MKKIFILAFVAFAAFSAFSQTVNSSIHNSVYLKVGYGMPGGTLKTDKVITAAGQFEVGGQFYINALKLPEKMKLGIDATFVSLNGMINKDSIKESNQSVSFFTAGAKVGPCFSYNFAPDWIVDIYFKGHPNFFIVGQSDRVYSADNQFKFGTSFGLNIRWKVLMLGCEFTSVKYDFSVIDPLADGVSPVSVNKTVKLPVTNISLGVNF